jgi:hypothetical protein
LGSVARPKLHGSSSDSQMLNKSFCIENHCSPNGKFSHAPVHHRTIRGCLDMQGFLAMRCLLPALESELSSLQFDST